MLEEIGIFLIVQSFCCCNICSPFPQSYALVISFSLVSAHTFGLSKLITTAALYLSLAPSVSIHPGFLCSVPEPCICSSPLLMPSCVFYFPHSAIHFGFLCVCEIWTSCHCSAFSFVLDKKFIYFLHPPSSGVGVCIWVLRSSSHTALHDNKNLYYHVSILATAGFSVCRFCMSVQFFWIQYLRGNNQLDSRMN